MEGPQEFHNKEKLRKLLIIIKKMDLVVWRPKSTRLWKMKRSLKKLFKTLSIWGVKTKTTCIIGAISSIKIVQRSIKVLKIISGLRLKQQNKMKDNISKNLFTWEISSSNRGKEIQNCFCFNEKKCYPKLSRIK